MCGIGRLIAASPKLSLKEKCAAFFVTRVRPSFGIRYWLKHVTATMRAVKITRVRALSNARSRVGKNEGGHAKICIIEIRINDCLKNS